MSEERVCCNCRHNIRKATKCGITCLCDINNHYIGYLECFEGWCRRWGKSHKFDDVEVEE